MEYFKKIQGSADIPLNEQANITKTKLENLDIDMIFSSPLIRAKQTADIINSNINLNIIYDERLKEIMVNLKVLVNLHLIIMNFGHIVKI